MIVIGLTGYAQSGKDTIADYMETAHGFEKVSFAEPLKEMLLALNPQVGFKRNWLGIKKPVYLDDVYVEYYDHEGVKKSPYGEEVRGLWQRLGTDAVRKYDDMFWVRAAFQKLTRDDGRYVFTDVRFPNEADAINQLMAIPTYETANWQITRPGVGPVNGHSSEQHVGKMNEHYTIANDGNLADLWLMADRVLNHMQVPEYVESPYKEFDPLPF